MDRSIIMRGFHTVTVSWIAVFIATLFILNIMGGSALAATAAGTIIGNSATATYYDDDNNSYTTTSNIVQTVVNEVCGADLTPAAGVTVSGVPGQTVYLSYTVTNSGNGENTFDITESVGSYAQVFYIDTNGNGVPDAGESTTTSVTLALNESIGIVVAVTIPAGASGGDSDSLTLTITGTAPAGCNDTAAGTINVTVDASIFGYKSVNLQTASPGDTLTYTISFQNIGLVAADSKDGFSVDTDDNGTVETSIEGILVSDQIPAGSAYSTGTASGSPASNPTGYPVYSADGTDWYLTEASVPGGAAAITDVGFFMEDSAPTDNTLSDVLDVDQQGTLTFDVTVDDPFGESDNSVDNDALIEYSDSGGGAQSTTTNETHTNIPAAASADIAIGGLGGWSYASSWTTGNSSPTAEEDGTYTDDNYANNVPAGAWVSFQHRAGNNGSASDILNLELDTANTSLPSGYVVEFWNSDGSAKLIDNSGDGKVDVGTIAASGTKDFTVKIYIPSSTAAAALDGTPDYYASIKATSTNNVSEVDRTRDNIDGIVGAGVDIAGIDTLPSVSYRAADGDDDASDGNTDGTNDSDDITATEQAITTDPGTTISYRLQVANTGSFADSFDLSASGEPSGSTITIYTDANCDGSTTDESEITNTGLIGSSSVRANDGDCTNSTTKLCLYDISNISAADELVVDTDGALRTVASVSVSEQSVTLVGGDALSGAATEGDLVAKSFCAILEIDVPAGTASGTNNIVVTATSPLSAASNNIDVALDVNELCSVSVTPDGSDQLPAGGTTTYNHTLTNNGNSTKSITVVITEAGSTTLVYTIVADTDGDTNNEIYAAATGFTKSIAAGASFDFQVTVFAPANVALGTIESVTVDADAGTCSATAKDITTVIEGYLQLTKSADVANAAPADTITYTILYKNIGSLDATNLVITDSIPIYTTYSTGTLCASDCAGSCGSTYTDGSGDDVAEYDSGNGLVRFRVGAGADSASGGTLTPGAQGCIQFKVTVD